MSQSENQRSAKKTEPKSDGVHADRELSNAELEAVSAAGDPTKEPPGGPQKKPEPNGM
jgi:hypothetical protein